LQDKTTFIFYILFHQATTAQNEKKQRKLKDTNTINYKNVKEISISYTN